MSLLNHRLRRDRFWMLLLLPALAALGGCNILAFPLYVISPPELTAKQPAEYGGLEGKTLAVVVYASVNTLYEFRHSDPRLELAMAVEQELSKRLKDVRVVSPARVVRYQDQNIYWDTMPLPDVGRALAAERVLYISLSEYTMREPGSSNLARGRISAIASVWSSDSSDKEDASKWRKENVSVVFPEDRPVGMLVENSTQLRLHTQQIFAEKLVRNFYDHRVPKSQKD